jgi:hypothetical protein
MKHLALIILIILSVFVLGCAKHAPVTVNPNTAPVVEDQTPVAQPSDNNMPPPPPPEPSIIPTETVS